MASSFAVAGACASFSSGEDASSLDAGAGEGAAGDAPGGNPGDGAADAPPPLDASFDAPNLLANGDFALGCTGWAGSNSSLTDDSTARSSPQSCRVCASATSRFSIMQNVVRPVLPGETYVVEAYVHAPADASAPADPLQVYLYAFAGPTYEQSLSTGVIPGATWQKVGGLLVVGDGGTTLEVAFASTDPGDAGSRNCFLVDDARLYRTKP